jgi:hypothetical protein
VSEPEATTEPAAAAPAGLIAGYEAGPFFDEMIDAAGRPRPHYQALYERLAALTDQGLERSASRSGAARLGPDRSRSRAIRRAGRPESE